MVPMDVSSIKIRPSDPCSFFLRVVSVSLKSFFCYYDPAGVTMLFDWQGNGKALLFLDW